MMPQKLSCYNAILHYVSKYPSKNFSRMELARIIAEEYILNLDTVASVITKVIKPINEDDDFGNRHLGRYRGRELLIRSQDTNKKGLVIKALPNIVEIFNEKYFNGLMEL